jgi:hypothetical protein
MEIIQSLIDNWDVVLASCTAVVVGADKFMLVLVTTLGNIRDTWFQTFPKKYIIK